MRTAVLDIETTALEAVGAGVLLMAAIKEPGTNARVLRIDQYDCKPGKEIPLVEDILKAIGEYDILIGHAIDGFDWPYIKSKAAIFNLGLPSPLPLSYDTLKGWRRIGFRTKMNNYGKPMGSLDMVIDFFGLVQKKTKIYPRAHWQSVWGSKRKRTVALDDLEEHCVSDTEMTEEIFHRIFAADTAAIIRRLK